jgi:hypothetical protein
MLLSTKPHCDCTTVDFKNETVEPGFGTKVKVSLDVAALPMGEFIREVDVIAKAQNKELRGTITIQGEKL